MNQYSLKFFNENLENEYQMQFQQVYYILFTSLQSGAFLLISIKLILNLIEKDRTLIYIGPSVLVYLEVYKDWHYYSQLYDHGFTTSNKKFRPLSEFHVWPKLDGCAKFCVIFLGLQDFKESIAINLVSCIYRLVIANVLSDSINFWDILYAIVVFLYFSICLYYKTLFMKKFFLYSLKDNIYEKIIPQLATKPTFIFTYDTDLLSFKEKKLMLGNFLSEQQEKLHYFLRACKFHSDNLEQFLFKKINKVAHTHNYQVSRIQVVFGKKTLRIILTEVYLDSIYYILLVDQEIETNAKLLLNSIEQINQLKNKIGILLKNSIKILSIAEKKKDFQLLNILRMKFMQQLLILRTAKLSEVDMNQFIKNMLDKKKSQYICFEQEYGEQNSCFIRINKALFTVFFLEIFQLVKYQCLIKIKQVENIFYLMIMNQNQNQNYSLLETEIQQRKLLIWASKQLFEKYSFIDGGSALIQFIAHIFRFTEEPMSAFKFEHY